MSKFLIELPEREEIGDLVGLMADFIDAKYRFTTTLETDDERLARAVAGLTGKILTPEPGEGVTLLGMPVVVSPAAPADTIKLRSPSEAKSGFQKRQLYNTPKKLGQSCEICGKPAAKRSTICGSDACKSARQKRFDAEYKERKRAKEAATSPDPQADSVLQEEQPAASPFWSPWHPFWVTEPGKLPTTMKYEELLDLMANQELLQGTLIQDALSERYYAAPDRGMALVPSEAALSSAAGRGAMDRPLTA